MSHGEREMVQEPLLRHAEAAGWARVSEADALARRRGEDGLFFYEDLEASLLRLNPGVVTPENVAGIINALEALPPTREGNRQMLGWLRGHESVFVEAEKRRVQVALIDYANLDNNRYHVTPEWGHRSKWKKGNRPDVMFLVNGLPVALVECKNPKRADAMEKAVAQLKRYELETPEMLVAPQVFNITHVIEYFYGVTWNYERKGIFNWKQQLAAARPLMATREGDGESELKLAAEERDERGYTTYGDAVRAFFDRRHFLMLMREWILFYVKDDVLHKTVLRQHQTRAVAKVVERCRDPKKTRGLVWHTQGAGKTFTMITAAKLLLEGRREAGGGP
jgi:type I restriction enzyme R subunit